MRFPALYRASLYLMLCLATLILSIDMGELSEFAMLFPVVVIGASIAAFLTVDRDGKRGLPRDLANFLAMGSFGLAFLEYWSEPDQLLLPALGHWLVYLQLVKTFLPKTIEDDWFLFSLGLVQVLIGVFLSQSDGIGQLLVFWAMVAVWTLGLFHLHRESRRPAPRAGVVVSPSARVTDPYPGLVNRSFVLGAFGVAILTFSLGGLIFLLMPRTSVRSGGITGRGGPTFMTGYSDSVRIGQMGEILENDDIVMTIETFDEDDRKVEPEDDTRWRGAVLVNYRDETWGRLPPMPVGLGRGDLARARPARFFRHDVKLQLIATDVVFAHRPFFEVHGRSRTEELFFDTRDGALLRKNDRTGLALETLVRRPTQIDYQVLSYPADHEGSQPSERFPDDGELALLREVGDAGLRARLREIALPIVENIPAEDIEGRARAIEAYLTDPDRFTYSLRLERIDRTIDPVLDFLINRRQGHCEYFASAAVLLCRSIGIPARLINGFKGGDWNTLSQALNVRQKHAHSWAEILTNAPAVGVRLREGTRRAPLWLEVDPTPSAPRAEMVAHVGGGNPEFRSIYDFVRYVWLFYVVGFDRDRQQRAIYEPVLGLWARCREGVVRIGEVLWRGLRWLLDFRDINEIFSFRGFLAVFFTLLVASLVGLLGLRVARRIRVSLSRAAERRATREIGGVYLKRLAAILGRIGLTRSDAETPREFAERAAGVLSLRADPGLEPLERIPTRVVEGYYEVRFGHRASVVELHTSLKAELDRLDVLVRSKGR